MHHYEGIYFSFFKRDAYWDKRNKWDLLYYYFISGTEHGAVDEPKDGNELLWVLNTLYTRQPRSIEASPHLLVSGFLAVSAPLRCFATPILCW